jgi:thioredoxin 1
LAQKGVSVMSKIGKIVIVAALLVSVGIVVAAKRRHSSSRSAIPQPQAVAPQAASQPVAQATVQPSAAQQVLSLPRLVDLGSTTCIPCKMMMPVLEELKKEYSQRLQVEFVDVGADPAAGGAYGIRVIPTQIFFNASGKELWRHEGFIPKADILAKWKELNVDLGQGAGA